MNSRQQLGARAGAPASARAAVDGDATARGALSPLGVAVRVAFAAAWVSASPAAGAGAPAATRAETDPSPVRPAVGAAPASLARLFPRRAFRSFDQVSARGLPQHSIQALAQDRDGILWIATFDGVATFDGSELRTVEGSSAAPSAGPCYAVVPRPSGGVFVGSTRGVHVFDNERWRLWPTPGTVAALVESRGLWILDQGGRVWRRDPTAAGGWVRQLLPAAIGAAVALAASPKGGLQIAGSRGVARLGAGRPPSLLGVPLPERPTTLLVARDGTTWVGTDTGVVFRLGPKGWTRAGGNATVPGKVRAMAEDRRGRIWIGGDRGQVRFGRAGRPWTAWGPENGLKASAVTAILADREGTLWFGFVTDGLQQTVGESWSHWTSGKRNKVLISGIEGLPGGGLLVAAYSAGVWHWDGRVLHTYDAAQGLTEDARAAVMPRPGVIWVGTRFGIFESVHGGRFRQTLRLRSGIVTGISVTGFFRSPAGTWYAVSSSEGILRHGPRGWVPELALNRQLPDQNVRALLWRPGGELWVASLRGVTVFRNGRGRTLAPDPATGIPRLAQALLEVGDGDVWVGAFGGIGVWHRGRWRILEPRDGLPGRTIYSLRRAPDGAIWAGGSAGVGRYSGGKWTVSDTHNGLLSNECNVGALWVAPDGSVLVGMVGSLARFDSQVPPQETAELRVLWRGLPARAREGVLSLPLGQRAVHLAWRAPWLRPGRVLYRSRVLRLGQAWSPPRSTAELTLASLGPGDWTVEVAARLESPPSSPWTSPARLRLRLPPYFWETPWSWVVYAAMALLLVLAVVRLRTRRLERRAQELQAGIDAGLAQIRTLRGLLPICAVCKKIRDDKGYWNRLEAYVSKHSEAAFTHGFCPECFARLYPARAKRAASAEEPPE